MSDFEGFDGPDSLDSILESIGGADAFAAMEPMCDDMLGVPRFQASIPSTGLFDDEDAALMARLSSMDYCPECSDEDKVCPQKFAHMADVASARLSILCTVAAKICYMRAVMRGLGAETSADMDLSIRSVVEEMSRSVNLIPKLRAAQEGMDSVT